MLIDLKQLKSLPVETEMGIPLGHIYDLTLETTGLSLKQLKVSSSKLLVFNEDLLISSDQILSITSEKIIVADNVKRVTTNENTSQKLATESATAINAETQN